MFFKNLFTSLFVLFCFTADGAIGNAPIVEIQQGKVQGTTLTSTNGQTFFAYRGIPFGKPPIVALRFQKPEPADGWVGTYDATKDAVVCPQLDENDAYIGGENCLTITIYTKEVPSGSTGSQPKPVMMLIHGGTFIHGSASEKEVEPRRMLNQDIVLVVPQYRLGALGYLCVDDEEAWGNYAYYDQHLALKWIQQNIAPFGGDPTKVTLAGFSAGAIAVGFHIASPINTGLFRAAIMQSGPTLQALQLQTEPRTVAMQLGDEVKCNANNNTITLLVCLRNKSPEELVRGTKNLQGYDAPKSPIPFAAVIQKGGEKPFLTDFPQKLFEAGNYQNVPLLIGNTLHEAANFFTQSTLNLLTQLPIITKSMLCLFLKTIAPNYVRMITKYPNNTMDIINAINEEYGLEEHVYDKSELFQRAINLFTDATFRYSTDLIARILPLHGTPVYLYSFEYWGNKSTTVVAGRRQIDHEDDYKYLLDVSQTPKDEEISNIYGTHWRNFVYNLKPTSDADELIWTPVPNTTSIYLPNLKYGTDSIAMQNEFFTRPMEFWRVDIPNKANGV